LAALAREQLLSVGVRDIIDAGLCTVESPARFFSYRRDGVTGRMAAAIWRR
jgi:copper oxidase (laccase) domain-containing protein